MLTVCLLVCKKEFKVMFKSQCHCGNIKLIGNKLPLSVTSCNCSICNRIGALWAYFTEKDIQITVGKYPISKYSWGNKTIDFQYCSNCGCSTHYTSTLDDGTNRVAINMRMTSLKIIDKIPVRQFDGANTWKYINEQE
jgi:hypothetical protein